MFYFFIAFRFYTRTLYIAQLSVLVVRYLALDYSKFRAVYASAGYCRLAVGPLRSAGLGRQKFDLITPQLITTEEESISTMCRPAFMGKNC